MAFVTCSQTCSLRNILDTVEKARREAQCGVGLQHVPHTLYACSIFTISIFAMDIFATKLLLQTFLLHS